MAIQAIHYFAVKRYLKTGQKIPLDIFDKLIDENRGDLSDDIKCYLYASVMTSNDLLWNRYDDAIDKCNKALDINPNNAIAYNRKGLAYYYSGRYDEATKCYEHAIEIDNGYVDAWNNKGKVLYELEKYDDAIRCYDTAINLEPEYSPAYGNRANAKGRKGDSNGHLNNFRRMFDILHQGGISLEQMIKMKDKIILSDNYLLDISEIIEFPLDFTFNGREVSNDLFF